MNTGRFKFAANFIGIFVFVSFITRIVLLAMTYDQVDMGIGALLKVFFIGVFYDFVAVSYYLIPFILYLIIVPRKIFNTSIHKIISLLVYFAVIYTIVFNGFSEYFFWEEFGKRFNFIAVDYLVYTHEVIHNILESYPIPLLVLIILFITSGIFYVNHKKSDLHKKAFKCNMPFLKRLKIGSIYLALPLLFFVFLDKQTLTENISNKFNQELAKNGFYSLFSAFRHNELDYNEFYKTLDKNKVFKRLHILLKRENTTFKTNNIYDINRVVTNDGRAQKYNIVLIMVESLSAEYLGAFGDKRGLSPYLDKLAKKSLFFNNLYATGTRTVRGMEAVTLSLPPTPGRSIVKRPDCQNMNSAGFIFKELGYDNKFIYAGHGYFDNMNYFFSNNGFDVVDRFDFKDNEVTFSNVWGVCDEDLLNKVSKEADKSYTKQKPFFSFVMTTSNHRPYTYPEGKIDIPSHTGRRGGVKYTDYAINKFLKKAELKPWFNNTIFVIVADHNGGSAGKTALPIWRYRIPLFIYAPKIIKPAVVSKLASQVDIVPTLLGILGESYEAKFYGDDILRADHQERAFVSNYQKLGLFRNNTLTVLSPDKTVQNYKVKKQTLYSVIYDKREPSETDINDTITYYQSASYLYKHNLLREFNKK
ncbi:Sulfatase family protein [hydrothermal vent metagenome]|uniref:Sulfatase family protein n=1 Tax=hydrothermal vent metagenome TaxID=652676 RepID=A0A1W1BVB8_9ZZZZ